MSENQDYLKPYREAVTAFGAGFEATLWTDPKTQQLRFDVMLDLLDFSGVKILDAGCGAGDFGARLIDRNIAFESYIGVDGIEDQIQAARKRNLEHCTFRMADFVHDTSVLSTGNPDVIVISGALNTMRERVARSVVQAGFDAAGHAILFNFLSDRYHPRFEDQSLGPARRFATHKWIKWALQQTPLVAFRQDYLDGHDATILMRHASALNDPV